ncbi:PEP-CTERM sorting domain-containing protein, partial [Zoogloea sp.]|uniref:PEP-CTERM sorting domain-containing protein n=1 Tax=Zoogloea sp. TaxID=49181 RepID=UPI002610BBF0
TKVFSGSRSRLAGTNGSTRLQNASVTSHDLAPMHLLRARTKAVLSANYGQVLNGGTWKNAEPLFPGGAFISDNSPRNDLDKDGQADDPGWIMLGKYEGGRFDPMAVGGVSGIVLDGFFSITETSSGVGSWALTLDPAVASRAAAVLGANYFDQFALVFKAGPNFAVYDFTAAQFGITNPNATDPAYNWYGTFDVSDTLRNGGGKAAGISHVSVWARDPAENINAVPEPGTLALLGLAGAALVRQRRKTAA